MKSTAESMQEVEAKKRQLEEHVSIWQLKYFKMKWLVVNNISQFLHCNNKNGLFLTQVDSLNEEVSRLKASEEIHKVATSKREEDIKMKETLEQQISQHREQHQKQVRDFLI